MLLSGNSNTTKVVYFPMALETAPLTWLECLKKDSIDSWDDLKPTTSKGRSLEQVLVTICLNANRNITSSYDPTLAASSTYAPPSPTSLSKMLSTGSTTTSPIELSLETLAAT
jgi:hypothetical protein